MEQGTLPADGLQTLTATSAPPWSQARLPCRFWICQPHNGMSQCLKINLSITIYLSIFLSTYLSSTGLSSNISIHLPSIISIDHLSIHHLSGGNNLTCTHSLFENLTDPPSEVSTEPQGNNPEMRQMDGDCFLHQFEEGLDTVT